MVVEGQVTMTVAVDATFAFRQWADTSSDWPHTFRNPPSSRSCDSHHDQGVDVDRG